MYVDHLDRDSVFDAMRSRQVFATRERGLRLDVGTNGSTRMGQFVPGRARRLAFELDLEWGVERAGMPLEVQVLTSGDDVPEVVQIEQIRVPAPTDRRTDGRSASPLPSTRPRPPGPYCASRIKPVRATHRDPTDTPATTSRWPTRARSISLALARTVPPARAGVDPAGSMGKRCSSAHTTRPRGTEARWRSGPGRLCPGRSARARVAIRARSRCVQGCRWRGWSLQCCLQWRPSRCWCRVCRCGWACQCRPDVLEPRGMMADGCRLARVSAQAADVSQHDRRV